MARIKERPRSAGVHGHTRCPLCREYPHWNSATLSAFSEIDADEEHFRQTGEHLIKPQTLEEFFAEIEAL